MAPRVRKRPGRDKTARGADQKVLDARSIKNQRAQSKRKCAACQNPARAIYCPACISAYPALWHLVADVGVA